MNFNYVSLEDGRKILFEVQDLSKISFAKTDITRVRFSDIATWGEKNKFKIFQEIILEVVLEYTIRPESVCLGSGTIPGTLSNQISPVGLREAVSS